MALNLIRFIGECTCTKQRVPGPCPGCSEVEDERKPHLLRFSKVRLYRKVLKCSEVVGKSCQHFGRDVKGQAH